MTHPSTILIVDDTPSARDTLEAMLAKQGYRLAFAADGAEALVQANALMPDLILLDVMMPHIDGFEVCRQLRDNPRTGEIPIILVTALDDRDSRLAGIEAGADDFVTKPFDRAELRTRVRTITRLNRFRRLLAERAKFDWVIEQSNDGYLTVDKAGLIHYANRQARLYLGLPPGDTVISDSFQTLVKKQYHLEPAAAWSTWPDDRETGDAATVRYLVRPETANAGAFWLQTDILHDPAAAAEAAWIIRLHDVTKTINMHHNMWEFHAMISHKLRTPLIGMLSGLEALGSYINDLSPQEITMLVEGALAGVRRLRSEIDDIVQYVGASHITGSLSGDRFDLARLASLVKTIAADLQLSPPVELCLPDNLKGIVLDISRHTLDLILRELLENSKKFHPAQSPAVTVTVSSPNEAEIGLEIADDGIHLSPDQLNQVWTPYYQGEKYFTGEAGGMGLGLPRVASFVWGLGGTCWLYNRADGPGVVVMLVLPVRKSAKKLQRLSSKN